MCCNSRELSRSRLSRDMMAGAAAAREEERAAKLAAKAAAIGVKPEEAETAAAGAEQAAAKATVAAKTKVGALGRIGASVAPPVLVLPLVTTGDGSCMLNAISRALWGVEVGRPSSGVHTPAARRWK